MRRFSRLVTRASAEGRRLRRQARPRTPSWTGTSTRPTLSSTRRQQRLPAPARRRPCPSSAPRRSCRGGLRRRQRDRRRPRAVPRRPSVRTGVGVEGRCGRRGRPRRPRRRGDGPAAPAGDRQPPRQPLRGHRSRPRRADGPTRSRRESRSGAAAAEAMLEERANDGRYGPFAFTTGVGAGEWRPTPPRRLSDPFAWVARVDPFVLDERLAVPDERPALAHERRLREGVQRGQGAGRERYDDATLRTPEQTALARFFTARLPSGAVQPHLPRARRRRKGLSLVEQARLFAMLNLAGADALINCWDDKAFWNFWRPITAIREGDADGNPTRRPAIRRGRRSFPRPPYPDHPSGYNCITGGVHARGGGVLRQGASGPSP